MYKLSDIIVTGKAQNDDLNVTTHDAETMGNYFVKLFEGSNSRVLGLFINTTVPSSVGPAEMIDVKDIEPYPEEGMRFFYQLKVSSKEVGEIYWDCISFFNSIKYNNIEIATRKYMGIIDPDWEYLNYQPTYAGITNALNVLFTESMSSGEVWSG